MNDFKYLRRTSDRKPSQLTAMIACALLTVIGTLAFLVILTNNL